MASFKVCKEKFLYNEEPITLISGAIHYFRVVPEYWRDRLIKLKACGFNTVETYVPWNIHEAEKGKFNFQGLADICKFMDIVQELGLHLIVRPGPFICAEWEFGGLPAWLLAEDDIQLRCFNEPYLQRVDAYFDVLMEKLRPYLCTNGGPIIAVQVENEYGSFGNDKKYLEYLKEGLIKRGIDVELFTSDGPSDIMLTGGTLPEVFKTVNFGSHPEEGFNKLKEYQKDKPLMCMEFWNGWFDHWGEEHHTRSVETAAEDVETMLKLGASFNMYMFHGGTNFGFYNGANCFEKYEPTVTSYDYDCLLTEDGEPTEKYFAIREVISKYFSENVQKKLLPAPAKKMSYGKVKLLEEAPLFENLNYISKAINSAAPVPMEKLGQNYGFILYRAKINGHGEEGNISIREVHDRAQIFLNGEFKGIIHRNSSEKSIKISIPKGISSLDILVENMGRVNYGEYLKDMKGILSGVRLENQFIFHWEIYTLPLNNIEKLKYRDVSYKKGPMFYRGTLTVHELADTFLELKGWEKGVVFINGFNIGRYFEIGPQKRLYVPAPILHEGENEIVIFELQEVKEPIVEFKDKPFLG